MLAAVSEILITQIAGIIVAAIAGYALVRSSRASTKTLNTVEELKVDNDKQHAEAAVARQIYNDQRNRDHRELMENDQRMTSRLAILEQAIIGHIEWEEKGKYRELITERARLMAERKEMAAILAEALKSGSDLPLDRLVQLLAGQETPEI